VVQTTDDWKLDHLAGLGRLQRARLGRVLAERQMSATRVIVLANESPKQPSQVPLVHDDYMIEELSPQCADNAFRIWILPRGPSGNDHFLDAQMLDAIPKEAAVDSVTIPQQVAVLPVTTSCTFPFGSSTPWLSPRFWASLC
jgi:hypothetical protein